MSDEKRNIPKVRIRNETLHALTVHLLVEGDVGGPLGGVVLTLVVKDEALAEKQPGRSSDD